MLVVDGVPSAAVPSIWDRAIPFVERALAEGGGHFLPADVLAALERAEMQLWGVWDEHRLVGALVTEIVSWPRRRICRLVLAGAEDGRRLEWLPWRGLIEAWARAEGCNGMEIYGRPGWARLVPAARRRVVLEWDLAKENER